MRQTRGADRHAGVLSARAESDQREVKAEALYRLALWHRRERRFAEAAAIWREILELTEPRAVRRMSGMRALRQFAAEALAIHHEHRDRDLDSARELALFALEEADADRRSQTACGTGSRGSTERSPKNRRSALVELSVECRRARRVAADPVAALFRCGGGLFGLLRLRGGLAALGRLDAEALREPLDAAFRVDQLLPAGEERMAVVADFEVQLRLGRPGLPRRAARAPRLDLVDTWDESLPSQQAPWACREKIIIPLALTARNLCTTGAYYGWSKSAPYSM